MGERFSTPYREYDNEGNEIIKNITTSVTRKHREDTPSEEGGLPPIEESTYSKDKSITKQVTEALLGRKAEMVKKEFENNGNKYKGGIDMPKKKFEDQYKSNA